jgi:hypothetical protein
MWIGGADGPQALAALPHGVEDGGGERGAEHHGTAGADRRVDLDVRLELARHEQRIRPTAQVVELLIHQPRRGLLSTAVRLRHLPLVPPLDEHVVTLHEDTDVRPIGTGRAEAVA